MNDEPLVSAGNVAGGADFTTRLGDAPSSVAEALGAEAFAVDTGNGGTEVAETGAGVDGPGGIGPPAYAGETTPIARAAATTTAKTALRRKRDNLDSNRGFEASTLDQDQAVLIGD